MSKRRKQPHSPYLGSVALTPVKIASGYETRDEFFAREAREEQERREAPFKKVRDEYVSILREAHSRVKKFFSLPLSEMDTFSVSASPIDPVGDYPQRGDDDTPDSERAAFYQVYEQLKAVNCELSEDAWVRLGKYAASLGFHRGVALTPETLLQMLQRLHYELECFSPSEISGEVPKPNRPEVQAPPQETEQQRRARIESGLEQVSVETREGRRHCIEILDSLWGEDVRNMYTEFAEFMEKIYHVDVMQDRVARYFGEWCDRWNRNPLDPTGKTHNDFRRALDKTGWFALSLLTPEEKLAASIENSDLSDRTVRANIARRTRELAQ